MDKNSEESKKSNFEKIGSANHLDDIYNEFVSTGGMENLKGVGKPLHVSDGDVLHSVLKNANYLPAWLESQKNIRNKIYNAIKLEEENKANEWNQLHDILQEINDDIKKYNMLVPNPLLQKGFISLENMKAKYQQWE